MNELLEKLDALTKRTPGNVMPLAKNSLDYKMIKNAILGNGWIRPNVASGRGRYWRVSENANTVEFFLNRMGIPFESGNDAPRGGKTGYFIDLKI